MAFGLPPDPDDQLFVLLQSMGYGPNIPLWQYQQSKRTNRKDRQLWRPMRAPAALRPGKP